MSIGETIGSKGREGNQLLSKASYRSHLRGILILQKLSFLSFGKLRNLGLLWLLILLIQIQSFWIQFPSMHQLPEKAASFFQPQILLTWKHFLSFPNCPLLAANLPCGYLSLPGFGFSKRSGWCLSSPVTTWWLSSKTQGLLNTSARRGLQGRKELMHTTLVSWFDSFSHWGWLWLTKIVQSETKF